MRPAGPARQAGPAAAPAGPTGPAGPFSAARSRVSTLVAAILFTGCDAPADLAWCVPGSGGGTTIIAGEPTVWRHSPEFVELWRAGGTRDDQALGYPAALAAAADGRIAIPDFMLGEVILIDASGEWTDEWMPRGPGPGEVQQPVAAAWDGSTLLVWDVGAAKLVRRRIEEAKSTEARIDGRFNAAIIESGEVLYAAVQADGSVLTIRGQSTGHAPAGLGRTSQFLVRSSGEGQPVDTLAGGSFDTVEGTWPRPGGVALTVAASADGAVAVADTAGVYSIQLTTATGERFTLCRDSAPDPVSDEESGRSVPPGWEEPAAALAAAPPVDTPAAIGRLHFDAENRLWVQRDRPRTFGDGDRLLGVPGARYDVYSTSGTYLGEVRSPPEARLQSALGDTVWAFVRGPLDETWVIAYELRSR